MKDKIEKILKDANVPFEFISLPEDLPVDVPSHMNFYKDSIEHALATMIYKTEKGFVAVSRRGDTKVNSKKLREALGIKRLSLASEDEMKQLGLTPGLVPPLGHEIPVYMDKKLLDVDYFYDGTGHKLFGLKMKASDLLEVNKATLGNFTVDEELYAKKRVFSGTRATGRLHLGNYLGAVKGYIALQNDPLYECIYMAVDVHTITTPFDPKSLSEATRNIIIDYLAAGLDPEKAIITKQSLVPEHTYLAFLFSSVLTVARMQDLPTFKEKIRQHPDHVTMALLNYPVLMAADILAYKASLVPCGIDQEPHLEVTREVARKMNEAFGTDFPQVQRFATKGEYVPSLLGEGKMSKSVEGSYINLTDDLETVKAKLAKVPTDSGRGNYVNEKGFEAYFSDKAVVKEVKSNSAGGSGGVRTLLELVRMFEGDRRKQDFVELYQKGGAGIRYSELKAELAEAIYNELKPIQERRKVYENDPSLVDRILRDGAERARKIAGETLKEVKEKMGLV